MKPPPPEVEAALIVVAKWASEEGPREGADLTLHEGSVLLFNGEYDITPAEAPLLAAVLLAYARDRGAIEPWAGLTEEARARFREGTR